MRISDWSSDVCSSDLHQDDGDDRGAVEGLDHAGGLVGSEAGDAGHMGPHTVGGGGLEVVAEVLDRLGPAGGERRPTHACHHQLGSPVFGSPDGAGVGYGGDVRTAAVDIGATRRSEVFGPLSDVCLLGYAEAG